MTIRREDLSRGQTVFLRVGGIRGSDFKLRSAKVLDVMRAAVCLEVEGEEMPRTVRWNEIELSRPPQPKPVVSSEPLKVVPPAFASLATAAEKPPKRPVTQHQQPPKPQPVAPVPPPPTSVDALSQWVQQGASLLDALQNKRMALQVEIDLHAEEILKLEQLMKTKTAEMARLTETVIGLEKVRTAMEAA